MFGDISRFKDADHAASYLGLVPTVKKSAGVTYYGPITKTGSALARGMLCEAAQSLFKNDGPLGVFIRRVRDKKGGGKAVVAGARKLATLAYHILKNKEPYRYATVVNTVAVGALGEQGCVHEKEDFWYNFSLDSNHKSNNVNCLELLSCVKV